MKTIRSIILILLTGGLLLGLLGGCIRREPESGQGPVKPGNPGGAVSGSALGNMTQGDPQTAEPEPNRVRIMLSWNTASGANTEEGRDRVGRALEELASSATGLEVEIFWVSTLEVGTRLTAAALTGETIDLCMCAGSFARFQDRGLFRAIGRQELEENAPAVLDLVGQWLPATTVKRQIYAIPIGKERGVYRYLSFSTKICDELGYDAEDIRELTTWTQVEELMTRARELAGEDFVGVANLSPVTVQGLGLVGHGLVSSGELLWAAKRYGDLGDPFNLLYARSSSSEGPTSGTVTVGCLWDEKNWTELGIGDTVERMRRWYRHGLVWPDSYHKVYDGDPSDVFLQVHVSEKGPEWVEAAGERYTISLTHGSVSTEEGRSGYFAIPVSAKAPLGALRVLNVIYSPETGGAWADLMVYGTEGVDYVVAEDGRYSFPEGLDVQTVSYRNAPLGCCPLFLGAWDTEPLAASVWDRKQTNPYFGFTADTTGQEQLLQYLGAIAVRYIPRVTWGLPEEDTSIYGFRTQESGRTLKEYIALDETQLKTWLR